MFLNKNKIKKKRAEKCHIIIVVMLGKRFKNIPILFEFMLDSLDSLGSQKGVANYML